MENVIHQLLPNMKRSLVIVTYVGYDTHWMKYKIECNFSQILIKFKIAAIFDVNKI